MCTIVVLQSYIFENNSDSFEQTSSCIICEHQNTNRPTVVKNKLLLRMLAVYLNDIFLNYPGVSFKSIVGFVCKCFFISNYYFKGCLLICVSLLFEVYKSTK